MLPHGWSDAARQVMLVGLAYLAYELVRGLAGGHDALRASADALAVINLERRLHVFVEPHVQAWAAQRPLLLHVAAWVYLEAHGIVTFGALAFVYVRRRASFTQMRSMFMIALALALVGYVVYPTAPPRLMPQWGFTDPIRQLTGIDGEHGLTRLFVNAYAAIPSMHVSFALITGWSMTALTGRSALRTAWRLYPAAIVLVVVVTGNHYLIDAALGALTAAAARVLAGWPGLPAAAMPRSWAGVGGAGERPEVAGIGETSGPVRPSVP